MSDSNTLHIVNHFEYPITVYVRLDGWNCCDSPTPGQAVGYIHPHDQANLEFVRKDGHGCNGRQGEFILAINITMAVALSFNGRGGMDQPSTSGCEASLEQVPGGNYRLIVYETR